MLIISISVMRVMKFEGNGSVFDVVIRKPVPDSDICPLTIAGFNRTLLLHMLLFQQWLGRRLLKEGSH